VSATNYFKTYSPFGPTHGVFPFVDGDSSSIETAWSAVLECKGLADQMRSGRRDEDTSSDREKHVVLSRVVSCWTKPKLSGPWSNVAAVAS
jgi:hypothetical protein